jgi:hypothetical protein
MIYFVCSKFGEVNLDCNNSMNFDSQEFQKEFGEEDIDLMK